jgi:hypothetical protein
MENQENEFEEKTSPFASFFTGLIVLLAIIVVDYLTFGDHDNTISLGDIVIYCIVNFYCIGLSIHCFRKAITGKD